MTGLVQHFSRMRIRLPVATDVEAGEAEIVRCPRCGQLEIWHARELQDHGHCRHEDAPCRCQEGAPNADA